MDFKVFGILEGFLIITFSETVLQKEYLFEHFYF